MTAVGSRFEGRCHCGNVAFALDWPHTVTELPARRCNCSFCRRIDGVWSSHPDARLEFRLHDPGAVSSYRFGTATADFLFCARCGVAVAAACRIGGSWYAVVNVHTLISPFAVPKSESEWLRIVDVSFDGESPDQRLERRRERWISHVTLPPEFATALESTPAD